MSRLDNPNLDKSIAERTYDLFGDILLEEETKELLAELEADKATGNTQQMDAFFAKHEKQHLTFIHKYFHKERTKRFFKTTLPQVARTAAAFLGVLTLIGGLALANNNVRKYVAKLISVPNEEYTTVSLINVDPSFIEAYPQWQGECFPAYIPDGFFMANIASYPDNSTVDFVHADNPAMDLSFTENSLNINMSIDTEKAILDTVTIDGITYHIIEKNDRHSCYWYCEDHFHYLTMRKLSREDLLTIATSVKKVKE